MSGRVRTQTRTVPPRSHLVSAHFLRSRFRCGPVAVHAAKAGVVGSQLAEQSPGKSPTTFTVFTIFQTLPIILIVERKWPCCWKSLSTFSSVFWHLKHDAVHTLTTEAVAKPWFQQLWPQSHHQHPCFSCLPVSLREVFPRRLSLVLSLYETEQ